MQEYKRDKSLRAVRAMAEAANRAGIAKDLLEHRILTSSVVKDEDGTLQDATVRFRQPQARRHRI